jgi:hypothetical protein
MFQGKRKLILIIKRGFSKTVIYIHILVNHIRDICIMLIKGIGDNLMI